jgi:hypothetical protein
MSELENLEQNKSYCDMVSKSQNETTLKCVDTNKLVCKHCKSQYILPTKSVSKIKAHFKHGYCSRDCYVKSGEFYEQRKIGQKKRVQKLIENNIYHVPKIVLKTCKVCGTEYSFDEQSKYNKQYILNGFCCDNCYVSSGEKIINKYKTELSNIGVQCDHLTNDEVMIKYSEHMSQRTSSLYDKWKKTHYDKYIKENPNYFKERSLKAKNKRIDDFLIKHNIVSQNQIQIISQNEKDKLFKIHFNNITNHAKKCKDGRMAKYNNSEELYKESYIKGIKKRIINFIKKNYKDDYLNSLTDNEYAELYDSTYKFLFSEMKMGIKNKDQLKKWKISNIINNYGSYKLEDLEKMSYDEINDLYSEYHRLRQTQLSPTYGGFKRTKKGWYEFSNGTLFFYRSSWELKVCQVLNELLSYCVISIDTPEPIVYIYNGNKHHYFSDIKVTYDNGKIMYYEIKPFKRIKDKRNENKFESAKNTWGDNFAILTEHEIYSNSFKKILIDYGKINK